MSKLYIVATPIGNMSDMTYRAVEVLKECDLIACEDTRHTQPLLSRYGIKKPLVSYYKHREREGSVRIADAVESGKNVALVSDAGMPCVSDPGAVLVREFMKRGLEYTVLPGANAAVCAAALTGLEGAFTFIGFLPEKKKERRELLARHGNTGAALIVYAAPHDINDVADCLLEALGDRKVYFVKEISKIYERVTAGTLAELREENPRGEYVVVVEPSEEKPADEKEISALVRQLTESGMDRKSAVAETAARLNAPKNLVYKISLRG